MLSQLTGMNHLNSIHLAHQGRPNQRLLLCVASSPDRLDYQAFNTRLYLSLAAQLER